MKPSKVSKRATAGKPAVVNAESRRVLAPLDAIHHEITKAADQDTADARVHEITMLLKGRLNPSAARRDKRDWSARKQGVLRRLRAAAELLEDPSNYMDEDLTDIGLGDGWWFDTEKAAALTATETTLRSVLRLLAQEFEKAKPPVEGKPWRKVGLVRGSKTTFVDVPASVNANNVGRRGGALKDDGATRAWLIRELDARIPSNVKSRSRVIRDLVEQRFPGTSEQLVNSTLAAFARHRGKA